MAFEGHSQYSENRDLHSAPSAERIETDKLFERFNALRKFHNELLKEHREADEQKAMWIERDMTNVLDEMHMLLRFARGEREVTAPAEEPTIPDSEMPREAEDTRTKVERLRGEVRELIAKRQRHEQVGDVEMAAEVEKQIAAKMEEFPERT